MSAPAEQHIDSYDFETVVKVVRELALANPDKRLEHMVREVFQDLCGDLDCPIDFVTAVTVAASLRPTSMADYYARMCGISREEAERMMKASG